MGDVVVGDWFDRYWRSFSGTIAGGTPEMQRQIIAERVLGIRAKSLRAWRLRR